MEDAITIRLNGDDVTVAAGMTVSSLLADRGVNNGAVVVEKNLHIVPKERYPDAVLEAGDSVEILRFVGGG